MQENDLIIRWDFSVFLLLSRNKIRSVNTTWKTCPVRVQCQSSHWIVRFRSTIHIAGSDHWKIVWRDSPCHWHHLVRLRHTILPDFVVPLIPYSQTPWCHSLCEVWLHSANHTSYDHMIRITVYGQIPRCHYTLWPKSKVSFTVWSV